jgi:hypothetical protein
MYKLFFKGSPVYDPRGQDFGLIITDPDVHLAVGEAGNVAFNIDDDNPAASLLTKLDGTLELRAGSVSIYKGRITKDTRDFNLTRRIETEGLLACLNDSVIPPYNFPDDFLEDAAYQAAAETGNVVKFFLEWVLAEHNSQVGTDQQKIVLGDVTVSDPNNYISRSSSDYLTAMETVKKKLVDIMGGYLLADYSGDTTVLHYYDTLPLTNTQVVEYGENLLDLVTETDATQVYTSILPVGKDGLTIEELPDGELAPGFVKQGLIIYSQEAEDLYNGTRIVRRVTWDDVTLAVNLQTKAFAQLSTDGVMLSRTITVKAVDLGGGDVSRFMVGRNVELRSSPHGFNVSYPLMELEPNLFDPGDTVITLGATVKASSDIANGNQNGNEEQDDKVNIELGKQEEQITQITEETQRQITEAIQTSESIIFSALEEYVKTSNYEEFRKTVEAQLEILASEINLKFTQVTEQVTEVDGDLQKTVEKLEKHFNFGINGLGIRASETAMTLTLDNDLIIFKKNGQPFGWWDGVDFHTGNIVIDVTERAQFGSFAFVPRSNGSLSFLKVTGANAQQRTLLAVSATYSGGSVPAGTSLEDLSGIVVTAIYSDNTTEIVDEYTLTGSIGVGQNDITVSYGDKMTSFVVVGEAVPVELTSISASYTGGTVSAGTALADLTGLTVTAHYSDGSTAPVTGYTLSGAVNVGDNQITVSYDGMTTTFTVTGEATTERTLTSISAVYSGSSVPVGTNVSDLTGITVTAHYSDGTSENVTGYNLSGTIAEGENTITITYEGQTTTVTVVGTASTGTEIALGPVTAVTVAMWMNTATSNKSVEYAHEVEVVDGDVAFINGSSRTFYTKASGKTNNYDILLGRYVKATDGNIYYINPDATYTHATNSSGFVKESISYQKAQIVSVI